MALITWLQMLMPATNNSFARNSVLSDKFIITNLEDTPHFENKTESFFTPVPSGVVFTTILT